MAVEINAAPGQFAVLTAKMLQLELESSGIAVSGPQQQTLPTLYIYVDSSGNVEIHRQKQRESTKQTPDDRFFRYPFRTDAFVAAVARITAEAPRYKNASDLSPLPDADKSVKAASPKVEINETERLVNVSGVSVQFTEREYELFKYLYDRRGSAVTRKELVAAVWDGETGNSTNVVEVYISYLRRKLEGTALERCIHTKRGQGYEFKKLL